MTRNIPILRMSLPVFLTVVVFTGLPAQEKLGTIVTGQITDSETAEPLENVNVFLSITTIGTSTNKDGAFRISNVPAGIYDLVASRIGYVRETIVLRVVNAESLRYDIKLKRQVIQIPEVQVLIQEPEEWKENLRLFTEEFIGETHNAGLCKIVNPEVLNLTRDEKTHLLTAVSDSVLIVDNMAFGYRIYLIETSEKLGKNLF